MLTEVQPPWVTRPNGTRMALTRMARSKVRDEFLNREEFVSEPQARALGASGKGSIIPNARTVPWDIRHRPNSRPLV